MATQGGKTENQKNRHRGQSKRAKGKKILGIATDRFETRMKEKDRIQSSQRAPTQQAEQRGRESEEGWVDV